MTTARTLIATGALCLTAVTVAAAPATATAASATNLALDAPSIVDIGGTTVNHGAIPHHIIRGGDRRPTFTVLAHDPSQIGHRMALVDLFSGRAVCDAEVRPNLLATCTPPQAFELGTALPSASIEGADDDSSQSSDGLEVTFGYASPTIRIDSYDDETHVASLSGTAQAPRVTLQNRSSLTTAQTDPTTGSWRASLRIADPRAAVDATVSIDDVISRGTVWLPEARSSPPVVTTSTTGTRATFHIEGDPLAVASVRDISGRPVGEVQLLDGRGDLAIAVPDHEAFFSVTQRPNGGPESESTVVVIHEGSGHPTPDAPGVGTPASTGTHAVVDVSGERGAVVTVREIDRTVIAVRLIGTSGRSQITIPLSKTRTVSAFTAEQSIGGTTSPTTIFTIVPS